MSTQIPNSEFRILNSNQTNTLAQRRLRVFENSYGTEALDLACHAAFPLTLTSDLVYCLREQFQLPCPWYTAADLLLSGLCRSVGYDLYEMEGETRNVLLRRLCDRFGESRLYELEAFVAAYIQHRLQLEKTDRPRVLGNKAEWEYACRGGTTTPFCFGETITTQIANYNGHYYTYDRGIQGKYRHKTIPVNHFGIANPFGLYDLYGNVWEWCLDSWHDNYRGAPTDGTAWSSSNKVSRVLRGGSWSDYPRHCRCAFRTWDVPGRWSKSNFGLRVTCSGTSSKGMEN